MHRWGHEDAYSLFLDGYSIADAQNRAYIDEYAFVCIRVCEELVAAIRTLHAT